MKGGKLPHFDVGLSPVHITYRLSGSIPMTVLHQARARRSEKLQRANEEALDMPNCLAQEFLMRLKSEVNGRYEIEIDDYLHDTSNGPYHLKESAVANTVINSIRSLHSNNKIYAYAICVMSNHVHLVLSLPEGEEYLDIGKLMKSHKGYTARMCNRLINRTHQSFWSDSYFDRTIRKGKFLRVMWYVLNNPVKAGLVEHWQDWPHTWVNPDFKELFSSGGGPPGPT